MWPKGLQKTFPRMHKQLTETPSCEKEKKIHNEITISEKQIWVKKTMQSCIGS